MNHLQQHWNREISVGTSDHQRDTYRFGDLPKACIHPLKTPSGKTISGFEMSDHVWHRGLWFTIKFVNGTNFWEEQSPFGIQKSAAQPLARFLDERAAVVEHELIWTSEETGDAIRERRAMTFRNLGSDDGHFIDWTCEFIALQPLKLDRTPYTTWGGYGGLSFRGSRELHDASFLLPDGETVASLAGQTHEWCVLQASVDGAGPAHLASLGIIDHPSNPRSPSPWYCKSGNGFTYINAAFLFHEPLEVPQEKSLKFRYRVAIRDGVWSRDEFAAIAAEFRNAER